MTKRASNTYLCYNHLKVEMKDQWQDKWNDRFSKDEFVYGKEPNKFLKEEIKKIAPGKILFLGEGEGRNAVYAASLGWNVDAVDYSDAAKAKTEKLSLEKKVKVNYHVEDLFTYSPKQNYYDVVAVIYIHFDKDLRKILFSIAEDSLKSGGKIILEVFEKDQIKYSSGGPKETELLYSLEDIAENLIDLEFEKFSKENIDLDEGALHQGKAEVIRFVGIKK